MIWQKHASILSVIIVSALYCYHYTSSVYKLVRGSVLGALASWSVGWVPGRVRPRDFKSWYSQLPFLTFSIRGVGVGMGWWVRLLCPWVGNLAGLPLPLSGWTGGSRWRLDSGTEGSLRCFLIRVPWQVNEYLNLLYNMLLRNEVFWGWMWCLCCLMNAAMFALCFWSLRSVFEVFAVYDVLKRGGGVLRGFWVRFTIVPVYFRCFGLRQQ